MGLFEPYRYLPEAKIRFSTSSSRSRDIHSKLQLLNIKKFCISNEQSSSHNANVYYNYDTEKILNSFQDDNYPVSYKFVS